MATTKKATAKSDVKVEAEKKVAATAAKADTKKAETEKVAAAATKTTATKAAEKKEAATTTAKKKPGRPKASATKATAAKSTAVKKTATKENAKKETSSVKADVFIQFGGNEYPESKIMEKVVEKWEAEGKKASAIKATKLYIKPEDGKAYYVINENLKNCSTGDVDLWDL